MAMFQICIVTILAASSAFAAPTKRCDESPIKGLTKNDFDILTLASNLELLELNFFKQGLDNYTDQFAALTGDYLNYAKLHLQQEVTHYNTLAPLLGKYAPKNCTYTFPSIDAASFNEVAQIVTSVGEAAYLGALGAFEDRKLAATAATILGVESRQNSFFRTYDNLTFYNGKDFDTPLSAVQAFSLAAPIISNCPASNTKIPFEAVPAINAAMDSNRTVTLTYPSKIETCKAKAMIVSGLETYEAELKTNEESTGATFTMPKAITSGTVFILISTAKKSFPVKDEGLQAIAAIVIS